MELLRFHVREVGVKDGELCQGSEVLFFFYHQQSADLMGGPGWFPVYFTIDLAYLFDQFFLRIQFPLPGLEPFDKTVGRLNFSLGLR